MFRFHIVVAWAKGELAPISFGGRLVYNSAKRSKGLEHGPVLMRREVGSGSRGPASLPDAGSCHPLLEHGTKDGRIAGFTNGGID
jgi:hypothetical protein